MSSATSRPLIWAVGVRLGCAFMVATVVTLLMACEEGAGPPVQVLKLAGDGQSGPPFTELTDLLVAQVVDAQGRPVPRALVLWATRIPAGFPPDTFCMNPQVTAEAATFSFAPSAEANATNSQGIARAHWTLGSSGACLLVVGIADAEDLRLGAVIVRDPRAEFNATAR